MNMSSVGAGMGTYGSEKVVLFGNLMIPSRRWGLVGGSRALRFGSPPRS